MKGAFSSPSFRKSKPPLEAEQPKKIGCIPSFFFFFHRHHHTHSRKRLSATSGKNDKSSATPEKKPTQGKKVAQKRAGSSDLSRINGGESSEAPSPKMPSSIRLTSSHANVEESPETPRRSPALVARLMGLEELPAVSTPESAAEKRRKLLGALEKCDEDLKALRMIIEALRTTGVGAPGGKPKEAEEEEQPSPVSVFDAPSASPPAKREKRKRGLSFRATMEKVPWRLRRSTLGTGGSGKGRRWSSRALVENVEEVWKEGLCGQKWECGRIAVALEGGILGDLMEEITGEMDLCSSVGRLFISSCSTTTSLPFDSCRRRLRF